MQPCEQLPYTESSDVSLSEKAIVVEKKIFFFFFFLVTSSEELFQCQRLGILSFLLIGCLVARRGSKGNSHLKFIGGKIAPGMSFFGGEQWPC